jgi:hypothetical protein
VARQTRGFRAPEYCVKAVEAAVNLPFPQCIKGTHVPGYQILRMLAQRDTIEDPLEEYPSLTPEDILASPDYAGSLAEEQVMPLEVLPCRSNAVPARDGRVTHG